MPELLLLLLNQVAAPSCTLADRRVEDVVASKARELHGHEACQYRLYDALADIDGDGVADFLVVFTIEGMQGSATESAQFLSAFTSGASWRPAVLEVGRRGKRLVSGVRGSPQGVELVTMEYVPADPMCCPTKQGSLRAELSRGKLHLAQ